MSQAESHKSSTRARIITVWALCSFAWSALVIFPLFSAAAIQQKVYGAIAEKWSQLKGETGPLGAAKTNEATAARGGRFNEFAHGFIYWHPKFGAHAVYGDIGVKWNQLGRERGFGYPLTDELPAPEGGRGARPAVAMAGHAEAGPDWFDRCRSRRCPLAARATKARCLGHGTCGPPRVPCGQNGGMLRR